MKKYTLGILILLSFSAFAQVRVADKGDLRPTGDFPAMRGEYVKDVVLSMDTSDIPSYLKVADSTFTLINNTIYKWNGTKWVAGVGTDLITNTNQRFSFNGPTKLNNFVSHTSDFAQGTIGDVDFAVSRVDTGGDHFGIATLQFRTTQDKGRTWSTPINVLDSVGYDVRNYNLTVRDSVITIFFTLQLYDPNGPVSWDDYYIYSTDTGATWSSLQSVVGPSATGVGIGKGFQVGNYSYVALYEEGFCELIKSTDGINWTYHDTVYVNPFGVVDGHEPVFTADANGRVYGLIRFGNVVLSLTSNTLTYGSWSIDSTNLQPGMRVQNKSVIYYDDISNKLISVVTNRDDMPGGDSRREDHKIHVYINDTTDFIAGGNNFTLMADIKPSLTTVTRMYGYPDIHRYDDVLSLVYIETTQEVDYENSYGHLAEEAYPYRIEIPYNTGSFYSLPTSSDSSLFLQHNKYTGKYDLRRIGDFWSFNPATGILTPNTNSFIRLYKAHSTTSGQINSSRYLEMYNWDGSMDSEGELEYSFTTDSSTFNNPAILKSGLSVEDSLQLRYLTPSNDTTLIAVAPNSKNLISIPFIGYNKVSKIDTNLTVTVGEDIEDDYSTLSDAFKYATTLHPIYNPTTGLMPTVTIAIDSAFTINEKITVAGGDHSYITITSNHDTVFTKTDCPLFFRRNSPPKLKDLYLKNDSLSSYRGIAYAECQSPVINDCSFDGYRRNILSIVSNLRLDSTDFLNSSEEALFAYSTYGWSYRCNFSNSDIGLQLLTSNIHLQEATIHDNATYNLYLTNNSNALIQLGDYRTGGVSSPTDIHFKRSSTATILDSTFGGSNISYNTLTKNGIYFHEDKSVRGDFKEVKISDSLTLGNILLKGNTGELEVNDNLAVNVNENITHTTNTEAGIIVQNSYTDRASVVTFNAANPTGDVGTVAKIGARNGGASGQHSGTLVFSARDYSTGNMTERFVIGSFSMSLGLPLQPTITNTYSLGASSARWSNIYSTHLNTTGTITASVANFSGAVTLSSGATIDNGVNNDIATFLSDGQANVKVFSDDGSNLAINDYAGAVQFGGRINGSQLEISAVRGFYKGDGTSRTGQLVSQVYDKGDLENRIVVDSAGVLIGKDLVTSSDYATSLLHIKGLTGLANEGIAIEDGTATTKLFGNTGSFTVRLTGNKDFTFSNSTNAFTTNAGTGSFLINRAPLSTSPTYSFFGDGDLGMGRGSSDELKFYTSGSSALTLSSAGNATFSGNVNITPSTLTGSSNDKLLSLTQTWNTTGSPSLIYANVTNTASGAASKLLELEVGGTDVFSIEPDGDINITGNATTTANTFEDNSLVTNEFVQSNYKAIRSVSSSTTILATDYTILVDTGTGSVTITLNSSLETGTIVNIKKTSSDINTLELDTTSGNIDGSATQNTTTQYDTFTVQFDGTNWWLL